MRGKVSQREAGFRIEDQHVDNYIGKNIPEHREVMQICNLGSLLFLFDMHMLSYLDSYLVHFALSSCTNTTV